MSTALLRKGDSIVGVQWIDVRTGPDARASFERQHLRGARWFDLETELSSKGDPAMGGRHPLPPTERFVRLLSEHGINSDADVVCYDDKGGANAAARLWWMLTALGHRRVRLLDGGLAAAIADGLPVASGPMPPREPVVYSVASGFERAFEERSPRAPTVSIDEVESALAEGRRLVIDVRDAFRYRGEREPIDPIAGRIPGAINVPLGENLGEDGRFLARDALAAKYRALLGDRAIESVIVHCGSGVTACHTLLALAEAGLDGAALYVGSFSEWCRRKPIATG
ncbi:MAG: sulfurtransferase [Myxococcales bacterium]|nr:sulfurtransferase [Myxococcales bacterium]